MLTWKETEKPVAFVLGKKDSRTVYYQDFAKIPRNFESNPNYFASYKAEAGETCVPVFTKDRITMFIAAAQGAGKSYYVKEFLSLYQRIHPHRPLYLFTGLSEKDKQFDGIPLRRVDLSPEVLSSITLEQLRCDPENGGQRTGCLCIFDDTDCIGDREVASRVYAILNDCLNNGRDHATQMGLADIDVIVTNHEINDYHRTKPILTECAWVVLFPQATMRRQLRLLCEKIGISPEEQARIERYRASRSIILHKFVPLFSVKANEVSLLR